jgi:hypothetical protein
MTMLDERLNRSGDDLLRAAATIPPRPAPSGGWARLRVRLWIAAAVVVAALVALPLWLGPFGGEGEEAPPVGGTDPEEQAQPGRWVDGIAVIGFLADDLTANDLGGLIAEVAGWDEVEQVVYFTREAALAEFRELFADQDAVLRVVENDPSILPASIRLILVQGADRSEIARRLEALPGVSRVSTADEDVDPAVVADTSVEITVATWPVIGRPFPDDEFEAVTLERPVPGTVRLVAAREQEGFGTLSLFFYHTEPQPGFERDGTWACFTAVAHIGTERTGVGAGSECVPLDRAPAEWFERGFAAGGSCLPRKAGMVALYGLDASVGTAEVVLSDGRSVVVDPVDGTLLLAWSGADVLPGIAEVRLQEASAELAGWLRERLASYPTLDRPDWCFDDPDLPG